MSFESERFADQAQELIDEGRYCETHNQWYLPDSPCVGCEDGDPPGFDWNDYEDEYGESG